VEGVHLNPRFAIRLNALALYAIVGLLIAAFYFQLALGELPCPLCQLQRIAFTALAVGPILTLRSGPQTRHYALTIIAALAGAGIAGRQVLLHVAPGDPGFGSAILGYHLYTWAFVCFAAAIAASAVMLLFGKQFVAEPAAPQLGLLERASVWLVIAVTLLNAASALAECGFSACAANPVRYELFS
jgi:disulfide bond formation protein DsbB